MHWNKNHNEREARNEEIRQYKRLQKRYAELPYHQRNYGFYVIALVSGWLANLLSGITEFSRVFVFFFGFLGSFTYGNSASWFLTMLTIILLEVFHRIIARNYFKDFVRYGGHERKQTGSLVIMLLVGSFLTFLSFTGGFDLIRLAKEKPKKEVIEEIAINEVEGALTPIVEQAKKDADEYRETRLWKGRLSTKDTKKWNDLKSKASEREDSLVAALTRVPFLNLELKEKAESQYQGQLQLYNKEISERGYGLGFVTIVAIIILYICIFFEEKYMIRRKEYLDSKYAEMPENIDNHSPTLPENPTKSLLEERLITLEKLLEQKDSQANSSKNGVATYNGQQKKT